MKMCFKNTVALSVFVLSVTLSSATPAREETPRLVLGGPATIENFPWLCEVVCCGHTPKRSVSAATLISEKFLVASIENLYQNITEPSLSDEPGNLIGLRYYQLNSERMRGKGFLKIMCGSPLFQPDPPARLSFIHNKHRQIKDIKDIWFIRNNPNGKPQVQDYLKNIDDFLGMRRTKWGNPFPLAFVTVNRDEEFKLTTWVQLAPIVKDYALHVRVMTDAMNRKEAVKEEEFEDSCLVAGWGVNTFDSELTKVTSMVYQRVSLVKNEACAEAFCANDMDACLEFPPTFDDRFCAKSLHFGDLCELDRGAAMYCPKFAPEKDPSGHEFGHVLGLVGTTGKNCGVDNLPSVFVKITEIIKWRDYLKDLI